MSAAERADTDIDAQLAAEFCRELKLRREEMKSALAALGAARDAMEAARDAVEPAKKRAWTAQLRRATNADELTRRFEDARHETDRRRRELAAAKQQVREAVEAAESDVHRMRNVSLGGEAGARVERMAFVTMEHAKAARDEAGLGPSPEDAARRIAGAFTREAVRGKPSMTSGADATSPTAVTRKTRRGRKEPWIVIMDGVEFVVGTDSMLKILRAEHVGCREQALIDALNNKGEVEGATTFGGGKNPPWAVPRSSLVAWGRARRLPAQ